MNLAIDPRLIARLSNEFGSLSEQMGTLGRDLEVLRCQVVATQAPQSAAMPPQTPATPPVVGHPTAGGGMPAAKPVTPAASPIPQTGQPLWPAAGAAQSGEGAAQPVTWAQPSAPGMPAAEVKPAPLGGEAEAAATVAAAPAAAGYVPPVPHAGQPVWPAAGDVQSGGGAAQSPGGAPSPGQFRPTSGVAYGGSGAGGVRTGWMGAGGPGYASMPPLPVQRRMPGRAARVPWWQREGVISRVLAVAGVGVTLIGVVMLLVLAAQAGFFGAVPRVVAGALFSAGLVSVGARVHGRVGGQVGAIALAATGIAGGYLDVVAVTTIYGWLPPVVGYGVALGIAAGGVALALQWRSQALAVLVLLGAALLAPVVTTDVVLLGFLIVLQIAALPVQLGRDWPYLHVVRTVPAVLATLGAVAGTALAASGGHRYQVLIAAIVIAAVGISGAVLVVRQRAGDVVASVICGAATVPLLAAPVMFERGPAVVINAVFAVVLLGIAIVPWLPKLGARARIPAHLAAVTAVAGACALLEACVAATRVQTLPIALFLVALGFLAVGGQQRSRMAAGIGGVFAAIGALAFAVNAAPATLADEGSAAAHLGISTALAAVAGLGVVALAVWVARRLGRMAREGEATTVVVIAGLFGLYGVTALTVSLGVAAGGRDGFLAGHGIATMAWMAAATTALLFGLRRLTRTPQSAKVALAAGLLLTAAALAKLFLFDLATLDGLVRAAAFLVVGVLLLVVGTRYARVFAETAERSAPTH